MNYEKCPICRSPSKILERFPREGRLRFDCYRCGEFLVSHEADAVLKEQMFKPRELGAICGYIRRNAGLTITETILPTLRSLSIPSVAEKAARLLVELAKHHPEPGELIVVPTWTLPAIESVIQGHQGSVYSGTEFQDESNLEVLTYLGVASAAGPDELRWLFYDLLIPQGLLVDGPAQGYVQITPSGWVEVSRLETVRSASQTGFVAMSFRPEFLPLYEQGIAPGVTAAGYESMRVDRHEHNNRIDDEIIALIKRSRFLVADFTVNRGGIYFEAGYGLGLGLPVIWTVREDEMENVHFDTRQFNHIVWKEDALPALARALQLRIERTIGRGPLTSN